MPLAVDDRMGLLEAAYEVPLDPEGWAPFLRRLGSALGAPALGVTARAEDGSWIEQTWLGLDASYERAYLQHFHRLDPWVQGAQGLAAGTTMLGRNLVADDPFRRSEFFQDFCRPHQLTDFLGAVVARSPEVGLVSIGLLRGPSGRRFDEEDRRALAALVPHLERVFRLQRAMRSGSVEGRGGHAAEGLALPTLTVDARMRVQHANAAAHRLLARGDGLRTQHAVLMADDPGDTARLEQAVRDAHRPSRVSGSPSRAVPVRRGHGRPSHTVVVLPNRRDPLPPDGVVLYVVQPDAALPTAALLRRVYGLTPAEARLAEAIASGLSPREVAERLAISWSTVRTQLQGVFAKTGTDREASLVRLLMALGAIPTEDRP